MFIKKNNNMERIHYLNYKKNNKNNVIIIGWLKILFGNIFMFINIIFIELYISSTKYKLNK